MVGLEPCLKVLFQYKEVMGPCLEEGLNKGVDQFHLLATPIDKINIIDKKSQEEALETFGCSVQWLLGHGLQ